MASKTSSSPTSPLPPRTLTALWVLYLNVALYACAFQMQAPVQPFHVKSLSADATADFANLRVLFAVLQLVGSLISGWLIDRFGARSVLILSFVASALSYGITARATTLNLLFLSTLPTVFQHAILAARAYASTVVPPGPARALVLSRIMIAYGVGMIVGPASGGWLASISLLYAAGVATALSLASAAILLLALPTALSLVVPSGGATLDGGDDAEGKHPPPPAAATGGYTALLGVRGMPAALGVKTLGAIAMAIFHGAFPLVMSDRFGLDSLRTGQVMSLLGGLSICGNALLVPPATTLSPRAAMFIPAAVLASSLAAFSFASTPLHLILVLIPLSLSMTVLGTINGAQMSSMTPLPLQGALAAADMAIGSGVRIGSPAVAAALLARAGFWSVGATSSSLLVAACAFLGAGVGVGAQNAGDKQS